MSAAARYVEVTEKYVELTINDDRYRLTMYEANRLHSQLGDSLQAGKELKHP